MNEIISQTILNSLKEENEGLTLGEIATRCNTHRNSAAKYLDVLLASGKVNLRTIGRAKLYTLAKNMPVQELLNITQNYSILLNNNSKIIQHSTNMSKLTKEDLIGKQLQKIKILQAITKSNKTTQGKKTYETKTMNVVLENGTSGTLIIIDDITKKIKQEQELKLLQRAVENSASGITIVDMLAHDQPLIYVNPAFESITGYRKEEVLKRNCRFLQGKNTDKAVREKIRQTIAQGIRGRFEILNYRKDGSTFYNELILSPVKNENDEITHYIGVQSDISYRHHFVRKS